MDARESEPSSPRRGSKSYRQSYGRSINGTSYFGAGRAARRLTTSRRASTRRDITDEVQAEQLSLLVQREWQLSYVTPLYHFRHDQLKAYSRTLCAFIAAERQRQGLMEEAGPAASGLKVTFSLVEGVAERGCDAETVFIQIQSKPVFAGPDESPKTAWCGWLTSVNADADFLLALPDDFVSLPLFLSSGGAEGVLTRLVQAWFRQTFDCCVGRLPLDATALRWLAALWTNCHPESNILQLHLRYAVSAGAGATAAPPLNVTNGVYAQDAWRLWSLARQQHRQQQRDGKENGDGHDDDGAIDVQEVKRFFDMLEGHFFRHFKMHLTAGTLSQVATALGSAKSSGRIKITNTKYMITTLSLLTEMAVLKMPI